MQQLSVPRARRLLGGCASLDWHKVAGLGIMIAWDARGIHVAAVTPVCENAANASVWTCNRVQSGPGGPYEVRAETKHEVARRLGMVVRAGSAVCVVFYPCERRTPRERGVNMSTGKGET